MDKRGPKSLREISDELNSNRSGPGNDGEEGSRRPKDETGSQPPQGEGSRESDRRPATLVLKEIGERFTRRRKTDKQGAYKQLQEDLMNNAHNLIPYVVSLKEVLGITIDIEDFLKGYESNAGRTPVEEIQAFLTSGAKVQEQVEERLGHTVIISKNNKVN